MVSYLNILKKSMVPQLCFAITFFISGIIVNFLQCILYLCLRPANKYLYRKINWYLCYTIHAHMVCVMEWWCDLNLILYMDNNDFKKYFGKGHSVCIMNHTYDIDWLILAVLSDKMHRLGNIKSYSKKSVQFIPVLGWSWKLSNFIFLERSFKKDKEVIQKQVEELTTYTDPFVLILFLEGTRFTVAKHKASEEFRQLKKMPSLKYQLHPRTRGLFTSLPPMRGKVHTIFDIILAFKDNDVVKPTLRNVLLGKPFTAYLYIKRIPMEDVPGSEQELKKYCEEIYVRKDKLKESFVKTCDFFATSGVPRIEPIILKRRCYYPLINFVLWAVVIICPMVYYLVRLLFGGNLFYCIFGIGLIGIFMGLPYLIEILTESRLLSCDTTDDSSDRYKPNK